MRVLVLASYVPSRFKGAEIRLLHLLRHLAGRHDLTLWALNRRGAAEAELAAAVPGVRLILHGPEAMSRGPMGERLFRLAAVQRWGIPLLEAARRRPAAVQRIFFPRLQRRLDALLAREAFDLIHLNQVMIAGYRTRAGTPRLLATDNAWAALAEREAAAAPPGLRRLLLQAEARKMRRFEAAVLAGCRRAAAVSEIDREFLHALHPPTPIDLVPNGVDTAFFAPAGAEAGGCRLVFTGAMAWAPNVDAMLYFQAEILPAVRANFPEAVLQIVGMQPPPEIQALHAPPGVVVTGFVPDVRPYVREAAVFVVPLRAGSGTRLKILEALAMGKAVVSTTIGAEGLEVQAGEHLLTADTPQDFAAAVTRLLSDPALRRRLGRAGRALVEARYDWRVIAGQMEAAWERAAA